MSNMGSCMTFNPGTWLYCYYSYNYNKRGRLSLYTDGAKALWTIFGEHFYWRL